MDDADRAAIEIERQHERILAAARMTTTHLTGPDHCRRCGDLNDRKHDGFAICTACAEEMSGEAS